ERLAARRPAPARACPPERGQAELASTPIGRREGRDRSKPHVGRGLLRVQPPARREARPDRLRADRQAARPLPMRRFLAIAVLSLGLLVPGGTGHARATASGTVVAWGCIGQFADSGQCSVPSGLSGVTAIAAGWGHSLALKSDGTVVAWGCNGTGGGPCAVPGGLSGVTAISAGLAHSLALKSDGTVVAWGCGPNADWGQCSVPSGLTGVIAIAAGSFHSLAVKKDGTVVAWGCGINDFG